MTLSRRPLAFLLFAVTAVLLAGGEPREDLTPFHRAPGSVPQPTDGFSEWPLCAMGRRMETLPPFFGVISWGQASLAGACGCGSGGGSRSFSGSPETADLGMALAPSHDMGSDSGQLPPPGRDHPFATATTGEVIYTEIDFVIPGVGFEVRWSRT